MWLYLKQCWKEFSSARNKIWYLLWNQSVCSSVPLPRKTRMTSVYVWPKDSRPAICKDLSRATGLGDLTVLLAQQAPQLVVSLTSKRRQHSAHPCMHILFWEEWLLDLSSYVLSEGSGKSLGMSCSKSLLLILSREANSELCGNTAWSLHSGGWGRWGNAKDHPPVTFSRGTKSVCGSHHAPLHLHLRVPWTKCPLSPARLCPRIHEHLALCIHVFQPLCPCITS